MRRISNPKSTAGMSLVELLVALALGLLITAGVIQIFLGTKQTYTSNEALARVQENGRFAISAFQTRARMATNRPFCGMRVPPLGSATPAIDLSASDASAIYGEAIGVIGWEFGTSSPGDTVALDISDSTSEGDWTSGHPTSGDLPSQFSDSDEVYPLPGSDVFIIQHLESVTADVSNLSSVGEIDLTGIAAADMPETGDIITATYCDGGSNTETFQAAVSGSTITATTGGQSPGNATSPTLDFQLGTQVFKRHAVAYFAGFSTRRNEPGLYSLDFSRSLASPVLREEVGGIENIQVLYGISSDSGVGRKVDDWVTADLVTDWQRVIAMRVSLLVRSGQPAGDAAPASESFDLLGTAVTVDQATADMRLRHVFATTLVIRNQAIQL